MVILILAGTQCIEGKPTGKPLGLPVVGPVVIAAEDTPADGKAQAHFICDGIDDDEEIQAVIDDLSQRGGGEVILQEGTFRPSKLIYVRSYITLRGQGFDTLLIPVTIRVKGATDVRVSDLRADADGKGSYAIDAIDFAKRVTFENLWAFNGIDDDIAVVHGCEDVIINNCTVKGLYGDEGDTHANIEIGDESKNIIVSNNTLLGGHKPRMGIQANFHPPEWGPGEDIQIIGNTIDGVDGVGIRLSANRVTVSNNLLKNINGIGIETKAWKSGPGYRGSGEYYNIINNVLHDVNDTAIFVGAESVIVTGNQITGGHGGIVVGSETHFVEIINNTIQDCEDGAIGVERNSQAVTIHNNNLENSAGIGVEAPSTEVSIVNNLVSSAEYGLTLGNTAQTGEIINRAIIKDNDFNDNSAGWLRLACIIKNLEVVPRYADSIIDCYDGFRGCLLGSTDYVHGAIAGTGAEQEIIDNITNPDFPRNISISATNKAAPSGYVKIDGINARGNADSEKISIIAGDTAYGNKAFDTITKITIPDGVSPADIIETGVSDKLGLSHPITAATDIFRMRGTRWTLPVDIANGTIDFHAVLILPRNNDPTRPNLAVWYKSRLTSD